MSKHFARHARLSTHSTDTGAMWAEPATELGILLPSQLSIIDTNVSTSVTLGSASYTPTLTITDAGSVLPGTDGAGAVYAATGTYLTNQGTIQGGSGKSGVNAGTGVILAGGTALNSGLIIGGAGHASDGGAGVYLNGGMLTNAGTISAGLRGGPTHQNGDAVLFGTQAGTLAIDAGAVFKGNVAANAAVNDVLLLAASGAVGYLHALGTQFTGFSTVEESAGATWQISGANTLDAALQVDGILGIAGTLSNAGNTVIDAGGRLDAKGTGTLTLTSASLAGGTLAVIGEGTVIVGSGATGAAQDLTLDTGASLSGYGVIADTLAGGGIVNDGTIAASGGTLSLEGSVTGTGALRIAAGAMLSLNGAATVSGVDFLASGGEKLHLSDLAAFDAPVVGLIAGDKIIVNTLQATGASFQNGTLSLTANDGQTLLGTLVLQGIYDNADFAVSVTDDNVVMTHVACLGTAPGTDVTVPGGAGSTLNFYVSGTAALNYASDLANTISVNSNFSVLSADQTESALAGAVNEIFGFGQTGDYTLATGDQITYVASSGATTVQGSSAGGDTVIGGSDLIYMDGGGNSRIIFTQGNNVFDGAAAAAGDTVVGGSGNDTINTGGGATTVFSGTGNSFITLNDTTASGDIALMANGNTTVDANGVSDTIFAAATGTIYGGTGSLVVTFGAPASVTLVGGAGQPAVFGAAGTDLTFNDSNGDGGASFVAGAGNETLNGAGAAGGFTFFADTVSADASSVNDSVTGGSGYDFFSTGTGVEDITAGAGAASFEIANVAGGTITINDFSAADSVNFYGLSVSAETTLLANSSTVTGGNLYVTIPAGTTVEFVGVTSLSGHLY